MIQVQVFPDRNNGQIVTEELISLQELRGKGITTMSASCFPSAQCDNVQDAKKLFDIVSILCTFFFGIPLVIVLLRIMTSLSDPAGRTMYLDTGFQGEIIYALILTALAAIPMILAYVRYRSRVKLLA
jgi:hypothetical protein